MPTEEEGKGRPEQASSAIAFSLFGAGKPDGEERKLDFVEWVGEAGMWDRGKWKRGM